MGGLGSEFGFYKGVWWRPARKIGGKNREAWSNFGDLVGGLGPRDTLQLLKLTETGNVAIEFF